MIALLLAAGYGTRLYPLAEKTPKALLPVKNKPILAHLLEKLPPSLGIRQMVLVSNHRYAESFRSWLSRAQLPFPWTLLDDGSTSEENRLGSLGDLSFAVSSLRPQEDLLLLGTDNLLQDDLHGFLAFARERAPGVTLGAYELAQRSLASRYGVLRVDGEGRVAEFAEKPTCPASSLISTAVYFFPYQALRWVLEYVGSEGSHDALGTFIQWLITREVVFAYRFRGPWFDIGDLESYTNAQEFFTP